ncbi:unnamed protein product [Pieris macdunnoughi]|uniref:Uncharacterized protein n=1 Tax=Pieris macdunnoughi TaxID=345717 RepID=A0A821NWK3_9NEOP|nr:unnamed protein product [Pieris macdunnoughi]
MSRRPLLLLCLLAVALANQLEDIPHNEVKNWALKFGVDLWEFGRHFTKMNQIQNVSIFCIYRFESYFSKLWGDRLDACL